ncbi:MAG: DegQ family serine endoprotease [Candidatus Omnitrophota bacterium]
MNRGIMYKIFLIIMCASSCAFALEAPSSVLSIEAAKELGNAFVEVAKREKLAVVSITIERTLENVSVFRGFDEDFFKGTPFEDFFKNAQPRRYRKEYKPKARGSGSGVIIDERGYILTNNHVVRGAEKITVKLGDGREFKAKIIGTDPKTDLALIKIEAKDLPVATLGDSDKLEVGQWVIAIGNPFGLEHTVTVGVVSAKSRSGLGTGTYEDFIQTDASINPGNSGGPLVNIDGEVIGINTMIIGMGTGIGFAIPVNMAKSIIDDLIQFGKVSRPWVGIGIQDVTPELKKHFGIKEQEGVLINQIYEDSPAAKAGLKIGDVIQQVDGIKVKDSQSLVKEILKKRIGKKIRLGIVKGGKFIEVNVEAQKMPDKISGLKEETEETKEDAVPVLGLEVEELTPEFAGRLGIEYEKGVIVVGVEQGSPAQQAGMIKGDIIKEINHGEISSIEDYNNAMSKSNAKEGLLLLIKRNNQSFFVNIQIDEQ